MLTLFKILLAVPVAAAFVATNVHPERLAMIDEINHADGVLWKAGPHARFASQKPGASSSLCGVNGDWVEAISASVAAGEIEEFNIEEAGLGAAVSFVAPASFDAAENWPQCAKIINDIRDQSNCGCCWAFGGAEAASDRMCIATNASLMLPLSAQDVCFGASWLMGGCNGGQINTPWRYIKNTGVVTGGNYNGTGPFGSGLCQDFSLPHCHHHGPQGKDPYPAEGAPGCPSEKSPKHTKACDSSAVSPHGDFGSDKYTFTGASQTASGVSGIQAMLMSGGPVETAFTVYSDFENYVSGIYHHVSGSEAGGHAVKIVGWGSEGGVNYWKVANSWNPFWGEAGYFRIRFGEGGIDNSVVGSAADATWGKKK